MYLFLPCLNFIYVLCVHVHVYDIPDMSIPAGGITQQVDADGRETGEAYVEFIKPEEAEKALYKDRQMIGHRLAYLWCEGTL